MSFMSEAIERDRAMNGYKSKLHRKELSGETRCHWLVLDSVL